MLTIRPEGSSYLLNFVFQPASALEKSEITESSVPLLEYAACDAQPTASKPVVSATTMDLAELFNAGVIKHVFATTGPKANPIHADVNGREGRRAICVLYGDALRYDVLDLDGAMEEEEEEEDEGEENGGDEVEE